MQERSSNFDLTPTYPTQEPDDDERAGQRRPPPGLALDPPDEPPPSHPPEIQVERLDPEALKVIARLRHMHHRAYLVGGCVRDLLLGHTPKDFDVATDAHPGEVRAIFRNCRLIGRRFRLAHVYFRGGKVIEVATFRKNPTDVADDMGEEGDLLITRDNVFGTAEEDAVRRDFTVNGLFYDVARGEVIDYVGGRADLEARRIATIGDPEIRMREDPVRALRAVRFAARLGFTIAPDTFEAMRRHTGELARCAPARVLEETFKLLRCGGSGRAFQLLRACGAFPVILPALGAAFDGWDDTRRKAFFAHLGALDRLVRSGAEISEAVLLGALVMHLGAGSAAEPAPGVSQSQARGAGGEAAESEAFLGSLVSTSRLPRKVAERVRIALRAQRLLRDPPKRRRARGRGVAGQPHFVDAQQLLEITVEATGQGREALERWASARGAQAGEQRERGDGDALPDRERGAAADVADSLDEVEGAVPEPGGEVEEGSRPAAGAGKAAEVGAGETPPGGRRRRSRRGGSRRRRRGSGPERGPATPVAAGSSG